MDAVSDFVNTNGCFTGASYEDWALSIFECHTPSELGSKLAELESQVSEAIQAANWVSVRDQWAQDCRKACTFPVVASCLMALVDSLQFRFTVNISGHDATLEDKRPLWRRVLMRHVPMADRSSEGKLSFIPERDQDILLKCATELESKLARTSSSVAMVRPGFYIYKKKKKKGERKKERKKNDYKKKHSGDGLLGGIK